MPRHLAFASLTPVKGRKHVYKYTDPELGVNGAKLDGAEFRRKVVDRDVEARIKSWEELIRNSK